MTYSQLSELAMRSGLKAAQMMIDGSREYDQIRKNVEDYCTLQRAADIISGQTDTDFGELDEPPSNVTRIAA